MTLMNIGDLIVCRKDPTALFGLVVNTTSMPPAYSVIVLCKNSKRPTMRFWLEKDCEVISESW